MVLFNSISINSNTTERENYLDIFYPLAVKNNESSAFSKEKNNKKFFLTRLPASMPETSEKVEKKQEQMLVIRKVKIGNRKSNDGFQIKPIPE